MIRPLMFATALALVPAGAAFAEHSPNIDRVSVSEDVPYADLNLESQAGVAVLTTRVRLAADRVCGGSPTYGFEWGAREEYESCRKEAMDTALKSVRGGAFYASLEGRRMLKVAGL